MKIKSFVLVGSMAVLGVAFTSCSKGEELYDSGAIVAQQKSEYATNFEKKYGPIDPNQTWDFATMEPISTLPSTSYAGTRGVETPVSVELQSTGTMSVEQEIIDYMHENFKPGVNNVKKGTPFYLKTQEQTFTIVPFYQGVASYYWELWMNIGGKEVQIWSKNQSVEYKTADGKWNKLTGNNGIPDGAVEVKAPTYTYKATKDQSLYFFLKVWTGGTKSGNENKIASSLDKMMLALEGARKPANVPADNEDYLSAIDEEFATEYRDIEAKLEEIVKSGKVYAPEDPAKRLVGQKLAFTTTDLDGNTVTSEELFSPNEITMVNCWGTWCPNCVDEMAELAEIHTKIQEKGCGIVGLEMESDWSDGTIQAAKDMMQEYGTNYPHQGVICIL